MNKAVIFLIGLLIGGGAFYGINKFILKNAKEKLNTNNFAGSRSANITAGVARKYQGNYMDASRANGEGDDEIIRALKIDKRAIDSIFSNPACVGMRMYFGKREVAGAAPLAGDYTIMAVGVDGSNQNITNNIWDECSPCPKDCPTVDF
ncbi:MAG: hypothetical protein ABJA78_04995 [Ferruginibacter sp.]